MADLKAFIERAQQGVNPIALLWEEHVEHQSDRE
jgi:hypothetical protein